MTLPHFLTSAHFLETKQPLNEEMRGICLVEGKCSKKRAFRCQFDSTLLLLHQSFVITGPSNAKSRLRFLVSNCILHSLFN